MPLGGAVRVSVAQDAEQPPHLGQRGAGGVADRGQPLGSGRRHVRGGQPRGLGLYGDDRDVVRDNVMQFPRDPGPLAAGGVLEQRAGIGLLRPRWCGGASTRPHAMPPPPAAGARPASSSGDDAVRGTG